MARPIDDQSKYCVRPGSPAPHWSCATDGQAVGGQSSSDRPSGESAVWDESWRTPADVCVLGQLGHTLTRRISPPASSHSPKRPDQLRTGQRPNSRLGPAHPGRFAVLAADQPGTRYRRLIARHAKPTTMDSVILSIDLGKTSCRAAGGGRRVDGPG